MPNKLLIAECAFGWGRMVRLYQYSLDVDGTCYPLNELTHIRHTYHRVLGVTSARIELRFGKKKVVLRGIAAIEEAQHIVAYLTTHYLGLPQTEEAEIGEEPLPEIAVPVRLQTGECAHYSTDATLCGEPVGGTIRYSYPARDHGRLILTNQRLIYMGRKSQLVLDYARLLHVSRLQGALAFQAEHWRRREIFEMHRPLECALYLERILEQSRQEQQLQTFADSVRAEWDNGGEVNTRPLSQRTRKMLEAIDN